MNSVINPQEPSVDITSFAFARRLANLLKHERGSRKLSLGAMAKRSDGRFSRRQLREVEAGKAPLDAVKVSALAALYGVDVEQILPQRVMLTIAPEGTIETSGVRSSFDPADPDSLLESYLRLVRRLRGQEREDVIALRREDIEALAVFLRQPGTTVVERLGALMGATKSQRRAMAGLFMTGALVITIAAPTVAAVSFSSDEGAVAGYGPAKVSVDLQDEDGTGGDLGLELGSGGADGFDGPDDDDGGPGGLPGPGDPDGGGSDSGSDSGDLDGSGVGVPGGGSTDDGPDGGQDEPGTDPGAGPENEDDIHTPPPPPPPGDGASGDTGGNGGNGGNGNGGDTAEASSDVADLDDTGTTDLDDTQDADDADTDIAADHDTDDDDTNDDETDDGDKATGLDNAGQHANPNADHGQNQANNNANPNANPTPTDTDGGDGNGNSNGQANGNSNGQGNGNSVEKTTGLANAGQHANSNAAGGQSNANSNANGNANPNR